MLKPRFKIGQKVWGVYCGGEEASCYHCGYKHTKLKYLPILFEINRIIIYDEHIEYGNEVQECNKDWRNGIGVNFADYPGNPNVFLTEKEAKKEAQRENKSRGL